MVYMDTVEISFVGECYLYHNSRDHNKEFGSNPVMISVIYEFTIFRNFVNFYSGKSSTSEFPISQICKKNKIPRVCTLISK